LSPRAPTRRATAFTDQGGSRALSRWTISGEPKARPRRRPGMHKNLVRESTARTLSGRWRTSRSGSWPKSAKDSSTTNRDWGWRRASWRRASASKPRPVGLLGRQRKTREGAVSSRSRAAKSRAKPLPGDRARVRMGSPAWRQTRP